MSNDRYHKAAKDGLLDGLKGITRKEANNRDKDSMTPVLWAAFEGRLDALRFLCGKGGDPDKSDNFGNSALHLAAAKGHLSCVDFLVNFGANIYALDIDKHSPKDLAAINNRQQILHYLDTITINFEINDRKKSKMMKELASKNFEKCVKDYMKWQESCLCEYNDNEFKTTTEISRSKSSSMLSTLKKKLWSSQSNINKISKENMAHLEPLNGDISNEYNGKGRNSNHTICGGVKFSELVYETGAGAGAAATVGSNCTISKMTLPSLDVCDMNRNISHTTSGCDLDSKGRNTISSIASIIPSVSEVFYVDQFNSNHQTANFHQSDPNNSIYDCSLSTQSTHSTQSTKSTQLTNDEVKQMDNNLSRSLSKMDAILPSKATTTQANSLSRVKSSGSLFNRPMLGHLTPTGGTFQKYFDYKPPSCDVDYSFGLINSADRRSLPANDRKVFFHHSDSDSDYDCPTVYTDDDLHDYCDDDVVNGSAMRCFLAVWSLEEYFPIFQKQQIDLDALMLLTESDLKSLDLPLGPFRKLSFAIQERRNSYANPGPLIDTAL